MKAAISETGADKRLLWIGLLTAAAVVLSGVYACATPFAALAALAALDIDRRDGLILVGVIWLANQIVGFGFLGYPQELQAYAWGIAIGAGAVAGFLCARVLVTAIASTNRLLAAAAAFGVAFVAYQAVLYAATFILPSSEGAFSFAVVSYVATVNAVAFPVLLAAHRVAVAVGVVSRNILEGAATMPGAQGV